MQIMVTQISKKLALSQKMSSRLNILFENN